ncbi:ammonium transporter [Pelagibacteraceae bacterium]|jgi:Amt family ammonium transporter|nr:ammonium transporter [Pelagibacteraceae bacterium]
MINRIVILTILLSSLFMPSAFAEVDAEIAYIFNTFSFLVCGFLVMWMAAGFCMLESGLVTTRSVSTIAAKNIGKFAIVCVVFYLIGYNLGYGNAGEGGYIGTLEIWSDSSSIETGYSDASDWFFQALFVCATASIVSGAVAERIKIWPFFIFSAILGGIIYPIQMGWEWGGGWLDALGFADFAGSTLVHACGGAAALAGVILLGPRIGRFSNDGSPANMEPFAASSIPLVTLGTFILWMGWYGFNGGSQLALGSFEDATAMSRIFMNTQLAGCGGCIAGAAITRIIGGKTDIIMMLNGALAGLVSITAEPLMPSPLAAICIGAIGGVIMYFGTNFLNSMKLDDVVGAIPVHMFAGIWGTMVVPFSNPDTSYVTQFIGVTSVIAFVFISSYIVISIIKSTIGLRISADAEKIGTDKAEVGVIAYSIRD